MDLEVTEFGGSPYVTGHTFEVKNILKRHGARWDAFRGAWKFESDLAARLAAVEATSHLQMLQELAAFDA